MEHLLEPPQKICEKNSIKNLKFFRKLLNYSNDMILVICPHSAKLLDVNHTACHLLGYDADELLNMKITDISLRNHSLNLWREHLAVLKEQEKMLIECDYQKKDGTSFSVEVSTRFVNVEENDYIIAVARDITQRKEEEKKLHATLSNMNELLLNIKEAFFAVDFINNSPIILSKAHEEIYGYPLKDFYENPNLWFEVIHPDDKKMIQEKMQLFSKGETTYDEHRIIRKDGKVIWVEGKVTPTLDENGNVVRVDGFVSDISKRKKAERLRDEKINEMNNFLYRATHDLKSPLASLSGLINLTEKRLKLNNETKEFFDLMKFSVKRMDGILISLTELLQSSNKKISTDVIDFNLLINEIKTNLKFLPEFDTINFKVEIQQKNEFRTDKNLLTAVLQNLIENAVKYHKTESPFIHISITEDVKGMKIEVRDNGIGIPEKLQPKIFDMFFRATEFSQGSGLGLYIVKNVVQKLFGKIEVKSTECKGSIFTVFLPDILKYISSHEVE